METDFSVGFWLLGHKEREETLRKREHDIFGMTFSGNIWKN